METVMKSMPAALQQFKNNGKAHSPYGAGRFNPSILKKLENPGNGQLSPALFGKQGHSQDLMDNLVDKLELSPETAYSMQYARAQFQINYQSITQVNTAHGVETRELSFSLNADFEFLRLSAGDDASAAESAGEVDPLQKMMDFFSPEKTAGRILDFALSFYPMSEAYQAEGDTDSARSGFAELMRDAIQKGFDQALGILGELSEKIQTDIDKTHDIVFTGLDDFEQNGLDPEKLGDAGAYESIQMWQMSMQLEYTSTEMIVNREAALPEVDQIA